ncbi:MAG: GGDEF domain-containing protein [Thermoanaerobaculia bacterium]|nr:MAG: GGDEF domain-containing protein [Thermoanaerobaculia bacterium]
MRRADSDTRDPSTDGLSASKLGALRRETSQVTSHDARPQGEGSYEAAVIVIAHPEHRRLGNRFALAPGATLEIGRSPSAQISLPEVASVSRVHARLRYASGHATIEDLGSRNGTLLNDQTVSGTTELRSGDRFQVGSVCFKFLHDADVEHAYHEAIYQLVMRDGLTEIFNRRKFVEEGERELARALRHGRPLTLILFDIDHFKNVNDTWGHLCGDAVLKQTAARVNGLLRPEQIFARIGGEEFAVLCPEMEAVGARTLAEKLRERLSGRTFECGGGAVTVTCSFGVAAVSAPMEHLSDLVAAADRALYRAKAAGRDRVEVEPPAARDDRPAAPPG